MQLQLWPYLEMPTNNHSWIPLGIPLAGKHAWWTGATQRSRSSLGPHSFRRRTAGSNMAKNRRPKSGPKAPEIRKFGFWLRSQLWIIRWKSCKPSPRIQILARSNYCKTGTKCAMQLSSCIKQAWAQDHSHNTHIPLYVFPKHAAVALLL